METCLIQRRRVLLFMLYIYLSLKHKVRSTLRCTSLLFTYDKARHIFSYCTVVKIRNSIGSECLIRKRRGNHLPSCSWCIVLLTVHITVNSTQMRSLQRYSTIKKEREGPWEFPRLHHITRRENEVSQVWECYSHRVKKCWPG